MAGKSPESSFVAALLVTSLVRKHWCSIDSLKHADDVTPGMIVSLCHLRALTLQGVGTMHFESL